MIAVHYDRGVYLPGCDHLWLDPRGTRPFAFISHAHSDHMGHHQRTILTDATARFMRARMGSSGKVQHVLKYGEKREFGSFKATLLPAGHVLGSAQILIEQDGESLLYTGDFKLRPGLSSEPAQCVQADTLIMETTFGLPHYNFPPAAKTIAGILEFCRSTLAEGSVPVLLGYSLGKAQEILSALAGAELPVMLHGSIWQMTRLYEELGAVFPPYERFEPEHITGHVLICPPMTKNSAMLEKIIEKRVAMITGWGLDEGAVYRYGCDAVFPLSDHADYGELMEMVELVKPSRIFTLHGYADQFALDLRRRGIDAWSLTGGNQLEFGL
ncbi:MAG: MBL fold metallo-hydrolase [Verrucomicrobiota bacterium]